MDIIQLFRTELSSLYDRDELGQIILFSLEKVKSFSKTDLILKSDEILSLEESKLLTEIVSELKKNKPIQYVLGEAHFFGMKLKVNHHVLIPRQETEELVDWIIKEVKNEKGKAKIEIVDVCTGSGCIAIALKKNISESTVTAIDVSEEALQVAGENVQANKTDVKIIQDDILNSNSFSSKNKFDIIVSNPPYVLHTEKKSMSKKVLDNEPHLALFVDNKDALIFYKAIIDFAISHLKPNGKIYFEINETKGKEMVKLLSSRGFSEIELRKDINGKDRMVKAILHPKF